MRVSILPARLSTLQRIVLRSLAWHAGLVLLLAAVGVGAWLGSVLAWPAAALVAVWVAAPTVAEWWRLAGEED